MEETPTEDKRQTVRSNKSGAVKIFTDYILIHVF